MTHDELSIPEIAALAGVTEKAVRDWFDDGKLAVSNTEFRGHQRRRFARRADVEALLASIKGSGGSPGATRSPVQAPEPSA